LGDEFLPVGGKDLVTEGFSILPLPPYAMKRRTWLTGLFCKTIWVRTKECSRLKGELF